jgi:hypothetical protein
VYFYTESKGVCAETLLKYPDAIGAYDFKLSLAAETIHKLEELGMTHHINECAVTGVHLLYDHLVERV